MDFLSPADRFRAAAIVLDDGTDDDREALFDSLKRCASEPTSRAARAATLIACLAQLPIAGGGRPTMRWMLPFSDWDERR